MQAPERGFWPMNLGLTTRHDRLTGLEEGMPKDSGNWASKPELGWQ